jgi:hypothetical protein
MKALSVCQPWAWAIIHGLKTIENRWRPTRHRGPLVIHASRSRRYRGGDYLALLPGLPPWEQLAFGALIGIVDVVDCVPLAEVKDDPFAVGPWCWVLTNPRPIKPTPFKGQVCLFPVPLKFMAPLGRARSRAYPINQSIPKGRAPDLPGED